jgi:ammonia channel protein AmtB
MGCVIYSPEGYTTIFGSPTNLSAFVFNMLMGLAGGLLGAYMSSRGEPFWTVSGGLAGVIAVASGIDLYHPGLAFVIAIIGGAIIPYAGKVVERLGIDDAVGAVSVHGVVGVWSLLACGIFASGYPSNVGGPDISLLGQLGSIGVFAAVGFIPGYAFAWLLKVAGILRSPAEVEILGLDLSEIPAAPYPEGIPATAVAPHFVAVNGGAGTPPVGSYNAPEA